MLGKAAYKLLPQERILLAAKAEKLPEQLIQISSDSQERRTTLLQAWDCVVGESLPQLF